MLRQPDPPRPAARPAILRLVALLVVVMLAPAARAQLLPLVPDPITTPELMRCADALELSDQQRLQLLSLHDDYKQRYQRFEDRDIRKLQDALLDIAMRFTRGMFSIPEREQLEDLLEQFRRVHARSQTIDGTLFDAIAPMLSEPQMPALERARITRALATYQAVVFELVHELNGGAGVNLSESVLTLDCTPEEVAQLDLILPGYERSMLRKARTIYRVLDEATTVILDKVDELGLRGMTPEQMFETFQDEQVQQSLMTTFDEASRPLQAAAFELSQLNLETFRRLLPVLSEPHAAKLRDRYYRRAYSGVYRGPGAWRDRYRKALDLDELTDGRRKAIEAQRDDFVRRDDQLADTLVRTVETSREYRTFSQFAGMQPEPNEERIGDLRDQRAALGENAESALNGLLGPELTAALDDEPAAKRDRRGGGAPPPASGAAKQGGAPETAETADQETGRTQPRRLESPLLAPPMTREDIELLAEHLDWTEDERSVLSSLYHDYLDEYDRHRTTRPEAEVTENGEEHDVDEETVWNVFEALGGVDDALFENATILAEGEAQKRLVRRHRDMRRRAVLIRAARETRWIFADNEEGFVDLVTLIERDGMPETARAALQTIEDGYEAQVTPIIRSRLEAARTAHRRMEMAREVRRRGGPAARRLADGMTDKWREAHSEARQCHSRIADINRGTLAQVLAKLPDDAAWTLRYAYSRAAYPDIFDDESSAEPALTATYGLDDLTPQQRRRVSELASEFRREYFQLSRQMVELRRGRDVETMSREGPRRQDLERELKLARLSYDRDELSARTRTRLRLLLTDEQAQRTGQLERRERHDGRGGL
ncbi:MAG: hypothetical protein SYC29_15545 [Planctomycetota bacterium]|nr:hypothetical protein [Planctomycetota bacterium]